MSADIQSTYVSIARAWVTCLGCYASRWNGRWVDESQLDELPTRCDVCGGDEFWVTDFESNYCRPREMSPAEFVEFCEFWVGIAAVHHDDEIEVARAYWANVGMSDAPDDPDEFMSTACERFVFRCDGSSDGDLGYAYDEWLEETGQPCAGDLPQPFAYAIDWESLGRQLRYDFSVTEFDGTAFVFFNG